MRIGGCLLLLALGASYAQAGETPTSETLGNEADVAAVLREKAQALRQEAEERFRREEAACWGKFLVSACLDEARTARREAERKARAWEGEAGRIERALREKERLRRLGEKAQEAERRLAESQRRAEAMRRHEEAVRARQAEKREEIERRTRTPD